MSKILEIVQDLLQIIRDGGDVEKVRAKVQQRLVEAVAEMGSIDDRLDALWADLRAKVPE